MSDPVTFEETNCRELTGADNAAIVHKSSLIGKGF